MCGNCRADLLGGEPAALDEKSFRKVVDCNDLPVVVGFGPQQALDAAARRMRAGAIFAVVDAERSPMLASRWRVRGTPSVVLFREGREIDRISGPVDTDALVRWVQNRAGAQRLSA